MQYNFDITQHENNYTPVGAVVEILTDDKETFKGLFFQDKHMIQAFGAYPELLCLDATYKLLDLRLPIYLMLVEDSNGESEVAAVCVLSSEDSECIQWMMEIFKSQNKKWNEVRVVMADKDMKERDVVKRSFPGVDVLICLFHTLRTFRREISTEKMGITAGQRTTCLEYVQKLAYASSLDEYNMLYELLKKNCPRKVVNYYDENWHQIKEEWVLGFKASCGSFLNFTNNRLESINGKLKQVIDYHSSLEEFVQKFFVILTSLRGERDHKAALQFQKVKVHPFLASSPKAQYAKLLTSYAFSFVLKQMKLSAQVKTIHEESGNVYKIETSEGMKAVTTMECGCIFQRSMKLPCRHILAL